ncbi:MAG: DUF4258 domain-containing protein [Patescibacteria group bacterium]|nr:DUF4258 domain-containing protein [Patescibacteria group bacterium]
MGNRNYGGVIWTNHALERLVQRGLPQDWAWQTFQYPEESKQGKQAGTVEYGRRFGDYKVLVVAKQNERGEWLILSCWVNPPFAKKAGFWKKLWLLFLRDVLKL